MLCFSYFFMKKKLSSLTLLSFSLGFRFPYSNLRCLECNKHQISHPVTEMYSMMICCPKRHFWGQRSLSAMTEHLRTWQKFSLTVFQWHVTFIRLYCENHPCQVFWVKASRSLCQPTMNPHFVLPAADLFALKVTQTREPDNRRKSTQAYLP